ncbi:hypothetical protein A0H81_10542 [Grifola frondosa]|uniref:Uncharacterized protein n=1 Tax=Grifola frondosa TaxID=5627 RepID=A0A1C7LZZ2_GRIFR|nr:hypothetical protein A0H81_10542 [Grifola frondosa]
MAIKFLRHALTLRRWPSSARNSRRRTRSRKAVSCVPFGSGPCVAGNVEMTLPPSRLVIGKRVVVAAFRSLRSWSLPTTHGLHAPSIEADAARLAAATCHSATPGRASCVRHDHSAPRGDGN